MNTKRKTKTETDRAMWAKLIPPELPIPADASKDAANYIRFIRIEDRAMFADTLAIARGMWRRYPKLVESTYWPLELTEAFRQSHNGKYTLDNDDFALEDVLDPAYERKLQKQALEVGASRKGPAAAGETKPKRKRRAA